MDTLLRAIRTRLVEDPTLTSIVRAEDITSSYNAEYANYPCIVFGIESGGTMFEIPAVTRASLVIDIYSDTSKQQLWTIYERIKGLLHNCERDITDAICVIHSIYEARSTDNQYDLSQDVWHLCSQYEVLYSTAGLSITTGAKGVVYADIASVSAVSTKEIARFRGQVCLDVSFQSETRTERERFGKTVYYHTGTARLTFEEMMFKASIVDLLWNINTDTAGLLNDSSTLATIYQVSQNSHPSYLQVLFQTIKTDDGKKLEIEAGRAVCQSLSVPFTRTDFSIINCVWTLLSDASGNIVKIAVEN